MKSLYFECQMGAAGDMLMAALYELLPQKEDFISTMNQLGLPGIKVAAVPSTRCGITGTQMEITIHGSQEHSSSHEDQPSHSHHHSHSHTTYEDILLLISKLPLPEEVKENIAAVYRLIGEAESKVHGTTLSQIHFHEVGTLDALADVTGCCLLISMLQPDQILCSPIHVGNGTVHCAHGILPVPAPATACLLEGIPYYTGNIQSELCTPTGAAILKHFVTSFGNRPPMITTRTGYGMGFKEFEAANCVRAFLLEDSSSEDKDQIMELQCNLDDMTGEDLGYAVEVLFSAGALDVYTIPIYMKKNRPGILLSCLCPVSELSSFLQLLFRHTSTRGVRYRLWDRQKLTSSYHRINSPLGDVTMKKSSGWNLTKEKAEFEDLAAIAREKNCSLDEIRRQL